MTQKAFRTLALLAVSSLVASAQLYAQPTPPTTPTTPSAAQQAKPPHPAAAPAGAVPPALQAGITAMLSAKTSLEQAGDKWGGHRIKAIALIDKALAACGQTQTKGNGEMKSGSTDNATALQTGITDLTTAQKDFQNAKSTWGGRRDQALPFITQALQELQTAASTEKTPKKAS